MQMLRFMNVRIYDGDSMKKEENFIKKMILNEKNQNLKKYQEEARQSDSITVSFDGCYS